MSRDLLPSAERLRATLAHIRPSRREDPAGTLVLDAIRCAEAAQLRDGVSAGDGSLLGPCSPGRGCRTPMGKRTLRSGLRPIGRSDEIHRRQGAVSALAEDRRLAAELGGTLGGVQDVARIAGRVALGRAGPRDIVGLGRSLERAGPLSGVLEGTPSLGEHRDRLSRLAGVLGPLSARIIASCVDAPPAHLREGGLFRDGTDAALDEARSLQRSAGEWLASFQERIAREAGLPQARVGYNQVFGYYVELTAAQAREAGDALVLAGFRRKQTLKNAERYTNPELAEFERGRRPRRGRSSGSSGFRRALPRGRGAAGPAGRVRGGGGHGRCAAGPGRQGPRAWVGAPEVVARPAMLIEAGRHPVLDEVLAGEFVPNDLSLGDGAGRDAGGDHRPQHGRQEHVHPAGCADRPAARTRARSFPLAAR